MQEEKHLTIMVGSEDTDAMRRMAEDLVARSPDSIVARNTSDAILRFDNLPQADYRIILVGADAHECVPETALGLSRRTAVNEVTVDLNRVTFIYYPDATISDRRAAVESALDRINESNFRTSIEQQNLPKIKLIT